MRTCPCPVVVIAIAASIVFTGPALSAGARPENPVHPAQTVVVPASRDNTLIESPSGSFSNGSGPYIFAGRIGFPVDSRRRAVVAFDLDGQVPPGSRILSAALLLHLDRAGGPEGNAVTVHRLLAPWGEGASFGTGGSGDVAAPGDATWLHTFFDEEFWVSPGGDFVPRASGSVLVDQPDWYAWGLDRALAADVQAWVDDPSSNHGWILIGDESASSTVKAFDSREADHAGLRPLLVVHFRPPPWRREGPWRHGPGLAQTVHERFGRDATSGR